MINPPNANSIGSNGIMETYDDRPISMYDNLNNMTTNMNPTMTAMNSSTPKMTKAPTMANTNATVTAIATAIATPPTSTKTNGAAHSTPFTDITFKFNENNNIPQQKLQQQHQPLQINGNRNLNEIPSNTGNNAAVYATPYKTAAAIKPVITTASPPLTAHQQQHQQHSPSIAPTTTTITNTLTSSPSLLQTNATIATTTTSPTAAAATALNSDTFNNSINRPLSQHSQSELNDTSHSIAAVKAALNEAKSKFFGLNGHASSQQYQDQQQLQLHDHPHNYDDNYGEESPNHQLLPLNDQLHQQHPAQQQQVQKSQPKYQNIPENSAIFRNQTAGIAAAGGPPPELPPKPIEYQNLQQQPTTSSIHTTPDHHRKMPTGAAAYNQISLNDIDGPASRSQTVYMATTVPQNIKEVQHPNPMGFQQPNLARWLLILQIVIGILLLSLSIWIFFLTPNTPVQDNPYWCGLVLLITGIIGLIVVRYQRIKRAKTREHCFMFLRMDSYVLSLLSVLLCCVALIFAAIHYCRLTAADTKCKSMHLLVEHGSCVCTFNAPPPVNTSEPLLNESTFDADEESNEITDNSYNVEYRDLSCQEVTGPWTSILGLSFILNSLGFVISLVYIVLLACCRKSSKRLYSTVRTSTF
ncbi:probable serine/threonine-protein kinase DDB_G0278665 isoform X2 [Calliphora vicina]|uniref:probable serine/threonine-protein kinase DDB_G0278665 isoform X2 n=1 Tax=Calliphora vicina TaxID=7373 RepID=UPI00325B97A2